MLELKLELRSSTTTATHRTVESLSHEQDRQKLLRWLQKSENTSKPIPPSYPGTGAWFLNCEAYQNWRKDKPSLLWCYGPPGVGKSLLAAIAVRSLSKKSNWDSSCVASYFCDFGARKQQDTTTILQSVLNQVVERGDQNVILSVSKWINSADKISSVEDLWQAFCAACLTQPNTYLILDAPDELENPKMLVGLFQPFVMAGCRLLVTSRDVPDLKNALGQAKRVQIQADPRDLATFVEGRFRESGFENISKSKEFLKEVVNKADGM